jgi:hypothetical protein
MPEASTSIMGVTGSLLCLVYTKQTKSDGEKEKFLSLRPILCNRTDFGCRVNEVLKTNVNFKHRTWSTFSSDGTLIPRRTRPSDPTFPKSCWLGIRSGSSTWNSVQTYFGRSWKTWRRSPMTSTRQRTRRIWQTAANAYSL